MTHEELMTKLDSAIDFQDSWVLYNALRVVVEYAEELSQTDYRGNYPVEHFIAKKLYEIIEKELK